MKSRLRKQPRKAKLRKDKYEAGVLHLTYNLEDMRDQKNASRLREAYRVSGQDAAVKIVSRRSGLASAVFRPFGIGLDAIKIHPGIILPDKNRKAQCKKI